MRPAYARSSLSNYEYLSEIGANEKTDPYSFAPSLIRQIAATPGQEIGTHTLSHYYCLEEGQTKATFEADLKAAIVLAARRQVTIRSIVFPRNQYAPAHLDICRKNGIRAYRGNPKNWVYRPVGGEGQTLLRRGLRLLDAHSAILGHQTYEDEISVIRNVPASQFLRPYAGRLARIYPLHLRTLKAGMTQAARTGRSYHLWWHPHNFGLNMSENLAGLRHILNHFSRLEGDFGMKSRSIAAR